MPRTVTANDLRWLGEEADGKRGKEYIVVWREEPGGEKLGVAESGRLSANETPAVSIDVMTAFEGSGLQSDASIRLVYNGKEIDITGADSVFITQSAFAKFVIPYYTRFKSPRQIANIKSEYFTDADYIGVAHFPPSENEGITPTGIEDAPPANLRIISGSSGLLSPRA